MVVARRYSSDEMICHRNGDHTEYQRQESEEGDPEDWRSKEGNSSDSMSSIANVVRRIPPKARPFINPLNGTNRRIQT
jgi:hypothetical protein